MAFARLAPASRDKTLTPDFFSSFLIVNPRADRDGTRVEDVGLIPDGPTWLFPDLSHTDSIGEDRDEAAKIFIEAQDRKIGEASGKPRGVVKAVFRLGR